MVRCTPAEAEAIKAAADAEGMPIAVFLRQRGLGQASPIVPPVNRELARTLSLAGSNLNQLAHRTNAGERVNMDELFEAIQSLRTILLGGRR